MTLSYQDALPSGPIHQDQVNRLEGPCWSASTTYPYLAGHFYEENTDREYQLVIIGPERGTCSRDMAPGGTGHATTAACAGGSGTADALAEFGTALSEAADTELPPAACVDVGLHFAARTYAAPVPQELEAEHFC